MHIYLHSSFKRRVVPKIICALMCLFCTLLAKKLLEHNVPVSNMSSSGLPKYLSVEENQPVSGFLNIFGASNSDSAKMNNIFTDNSKNATVANSPESITEQADTPAEEFTASVPDSLLVYDTSNSRNVTLKLEDYILGCVLAEMPSSFASQALMAQSVAARTFAVRKMMYPPTDKKHNGAQICTDCNHCQSYISPDDYLTKGGTAAERLEKVRQAVNATKGIIAVYDGQPINAVYHASSGHETMSSKEVWGGNLAYLQPVAAVENPSVCEKTYSFTYSELSEKLTGYKGVNVPCSASGKSELYENNDKNGCVQTITVSGTTFTNRQIMKALELRSSDFSIKKNKDNTVFTTYGYGHRVGMSQYGADALANLGSSYTDILKYYYKGISFACISG